MIKWTPLIECIKELMPSRMKGKTIMWWMSFNAVGLWWFSAISGKSLDGSIALMYGAALTAFAGTKGFEAYQEAKATPPANVTIKQVPFEEGDI